MFDRAVVQVLLRRLECAPVVRMEIGEEHFVPVTHQAIEDRPFPRLQVLVVLTARELPVRVVAQHPRLVQLRDAQIAAHGEVDDRRRDVLLIDPFIEKQTHLGRTQILRRGVLDDDLIAVEERARFLLGVLAQVVDRRVHAVPPVPPPRDDEPDRPGEQHGDRGRHRPGRDAEVRAAVAAAAAGIAGGPADEHRHRLEHHTLAYRRDDRELLAGLQRAFPDEPRAVVAHEEVARLLRAGRAFVALRLRQAAAIEMHHGEDLAGWHRPFRAIDVPVQLVVVRKAVQYAVDDVRDDVRLHAA